MNKKGFTLLEILLTVAAISILASIVILAINPRLQLQKARDTQRWSDVRAVMDAVYQYSVDEGDIPASIDTTLRMIGTASSGCNTSCGGEGGGEDTREYESRSDFDNGSYNDTQYDQVNDVVELTATGQSNGSGTYTSDIINAGSLATWQTLSWTPERPVQKALPDNSVSESAYPTGNAIMTSNMLLYHMDEVSDTIQDTSGQGNNGSPSTSGVAYGATGVFDSAIDLSGSSSYIAINNMHYSSAGEIDAVTACAWINTTDTNNAIVDFDRSEYWSLGVEFMTSQTAGHLSWDTTSNTGGTHDMESTAAVNDGAWHHVCGVFDASAVSDKKIYIDGQLDNEVDAYTTGARLGTGTTRYGFIGDGSEASSFNAGRNNLNYDGLVDEVVVYHRALSATEIADMYKRGSMRITFALRSCDDPACSGETYDVSYSELDNGGAGLPSFSLDPISDNQYLQFRTTLETDNGLYTPEFGNVSISYTSVGTGGELTAAECLDLTSELAGEYIVDLPIDPEFGDVARTYYAIKQTANGRVYIQACKAESEEAISFSR